MTSTHNCGVCLAEFATVEELQSQILNLLQGGELILIKASRSIKLEKVAITLGVNYII